MTHVVILGAGIIGLSCAYELLSYPHHRYRVTIVAEDYTPNTTSDGAGGIWFPYKAEPLNRVIELANRSKKRYFQQIERGEHTQCGLAKLDGYLYEHENSPSPNEEQAPWWKPCVEKADRLPQERLPTKVDAGWFVYDIPIISTPKYMKWLQSQIVQRGAKLIEGKVSSIKEVCSKFRLKNVKCVINCLGLGARQVVHDTKTFPIRGVVVRVIPSKEHPIKHFYFDDDNPEGIIYVIPRDDYVVLGGTADKDNWTLSPTVNEVQGILNRCVKLVPSLIFATFHSVWTGLRPGRTELRLEHDPSFKEFVVIHNYGHGGSGWTTCWGCAEEVLKLIQQHLPITPRL
jgi:D-amino-acid oxidase